MKTEQEITADRQSRVAQCKSELEVILAKYELALTAEDMIGEHTKVHIEIQFMDLKKHNAPIAQPEAPIVSPEEFTKDLMGPNDPIN